MEHAPPDRVANCTSLVSHAHSTLLAAEHYPPTTLENAYRRWSALGELVTIGDPQTIDVLSDSNARWFFIGSCNRETIDLFAVYFEWADILAEQASDVFLEKDSRCAAWASAIVDSKIANHAANVSNLISRFGASNANVMHLTQLLKMWGHSNGIVLPPLTSRREVARFQSFYDNQYNKALATAAERCQ
jgi:hypothetical protein